MAKDIITPRAALAGNLRAFSDSFFGGRQEKIEEAKKAGGDRAVEEYKASWVPEFFKGTAEEARTKGETQARESVEQAYRIADSRLGTGGF